MTPFRVIVADPPWSFDDKLEMSETPRGAEANYPTLTIDDIAGLPVRSLADDDAVLVLWRPSSLAAEGLRVMSAWGFRQTQELVWYKATPKSVGFGMGRMFRAAKEVAFVGVRGSPYRHLQDRKTRDVFVAPPTKHSVKPEAPMDALEVMFPGGPFLEIFARRARPGWTSIGNQAPETLGRDVRDVVPEMARAIRDARLLRPVA